jgi:putative tryptophan/tyrosine transport system substrate-binding protein
MGRWQVAAFREHLQKLGWTEGSNLRIDLRFGAGDPVRIRELARELLSLGPDLMVSNSNLVTTTRSPAGCSNSPARETVRW